MKLKKILALACSLVMCISMIAATSLVADAAVEGATATLEFAGYEVKGTTTFAVIKVKATIPETLVPYEMVAADWETTFEDTYKGNMIQSVGFDIPNVSGLTYVASLSSAASYVQIQDNKADNKISVYAANSGAYDTYYAGEVDELATLYYRITGDVDAEYDVALSNAVIGLVNVESDGTVVPYSYKFADFTVTNTTIQPEVSGPEYTEIEAEVNEYVGTADTVDYAYAVLFETASSISDVIWAADGKYSNAIKLPAPVSGSVKLGFTSDSQLTNVGGLFNAGDVVYYTSNVDLKAKAE